MEEAKKLLRETGESITSIASKVGYDDPYYFSHCFKKILGISPADYRKGNESA